MSAVLATFECSRWPGCGCPDGTMAVDCPGLAAWPSSNRKPRDANAWLTQQSAPARPASGPKLKAHEISATRLARESMALADRCDRLLAEVMDISAECIRIAREICDMHGVPMPEGDAPAAET
jgi:hypothetical protein